MSERSPTYARVPESPGGNLDDDTVQVLVYLFTHEDDDRDAGIMAQTLQMQRGVAEYHLEQLDARGLAQTTGGNYLHGHVYWSLTPEGRRYVVENGLAS